ncbi:MAG: haloacid dehalogenase [Chthonomonadales bacterium]
MERKGSIVLQINAIAEDLRRKMEAANTAREAALTECRSIIRASSRAIRAIHRLEDASAERQLKEVHKQVQELRESLKAHPEVYYAGYVHDAQKEYVEAQALLAIVRGTPLPGPEDLGVEPAAYLNGLAEAGSECRRYILDRLRADDAGTADRLLDAMDELYYELITFDFPDALTGGLRRTTDAFRAVLERTRGDVTLSMQQRALRDVLVAGKVSPPGDAR